jgi:diguanylate cyclase (GGDEF)-like protein
MLQAFEFAILRREGAGKYAFVGKPPAFYDDLFPPADGHPNVEPWAISPMLEFFVEDAEGFFARGKPGFIASGVWEEDGLTEENTALKAFAVDLGGEQAIVVRLLREDYTERLGVLRKAREQLQETRLLKSDLTIFREKSRIDGLTGIFNRTTFVELILDEIKRSRILEYPLVLLILDIDDFKKVNDTFGHLVGDKILQGLGAALKGSLRRNDILARYGGEEFAVLIPHAPLNEGAQVAEKIRAGLAAMVVPDAPRITVSIGCSSYSPDETPESFFKRADDALYAAKRDGKNRIRVK